MNDNNNSNNSNIGPQASFANVIITIIKEENEMLKERVHILNDHIEELRKEIERLNNENMTLFKETLDSKRQKEDYEIEKSSLVKQIERLYKEIIKIDYVPVSQYNNLYWGDNYPALKVLFDFLQKMNCLDINWSYFCECMSIGNFEPINLKSSVLNLKELGYILSRIKIFFTEDHRATPKKYHAWIQRKILLDQSKLDDNYIKKYVRNYNSKPLQSEKLVVLDDLMLKIAERYN